MSFDTLKVAELRKVAEDFAVDTDGLKNKADIVAALTQEGVTWSVYQKTIKDIEKATDEFSEDSEEILPRFNPDSQPENTMLVRMTRENHRYDILNYTFTKEHPFVAMTSENAQEIFDKEEGFRLATPKEVQEYYA